MPALNFSSFSNTRSWHKRILVLFGPKKSIKVLEVFQAFSCGESALVHVMVYFITTCFATITHASTVGDGFKNCPTMSREGQLCCLRQLQLMLSSWLDTNQTRVREQKELRAALSQGLCVNGILRSAYQSRNTDHQARPQSSKHTVQELHRHLSTKGTAC